MKMKLTVALFLATFTILEPSVKGQLWPWQTTGASFPTPATNIDGSDGGIITLNYAFNVNNLIPNGIRNWIAGGVATIQNDILNILGSMAVTNSDTLRMLNTIMSTIDQLAQSQGANAGILAAQIKALKQQLQDQSITELQASYSAALQSNSSLIPSVQALSQNIVTQLQYLETIISPTLPCASQAYSFLADAARSGANETANCLNRQFETAQDNIIDAWNDIRDYVEEESYGPDVYQAVQQCNNNTGVPLLISNVTKSSACWVQAALRIKTDTVSMLGTLANRMATVKLYNDNIQINLAQCTYSSFDVFSTNTVNAALKQLFTCAGGFTPSYATATNSAAAK